MKYYLIMKIIFILFISTLIKIVQLKIFIQNHYLIFLKKIYTIKKFLIRIILTFFMLKAPSPYLKKQV